MQPEQRRFSIRYTIVAMIVLFLIEAYLFAPRPETLAYSDFVKLVKAGKVSGVMLSSQVIEGTLAPNGLEAFLPREKLEELRRAGTLGAAIEALPAHYRAVALLRDVEGLSMAEVADALGITVGTAKTRAHRARLLLRKRLSMFMARAGASVEGVGREEDARGASSETRPATSASER